MHGNRRIRGRETTLAYTSSPMTLAFALHTDAPCFAIIDLETTGLNAEIDRIVECAILTCAPDGTVIDRWESLVGSDVDGPVGARALHGLDTDALSDAPTFETLLPSIVERLRNRVVVGHVLSFDVAFLAAEAARASYAMPELGSAGWCTRELCRSHLQGDSYALAACCVRAGIDQRDPHTALGDAHATAALLATVLHRAHLDPTIALEHAHRLAWAATSISSDDIALARPRSREPVSVR
jgi:DNA polymerase III subunit epsilon